MQSTGLVGGYSEVDLTSLRNDFPNGFQAVAEANREETQVVLAIAGTDPLDPNDLRADTTFLKPTGAPTTTFQSYVSEAASLLHFLVDKYPTATITLTGHSLGGAIAQLLADASGLSAITFNAPGPGETIPYFDGTISAIIGEVATKPTTQAITNYRVYGDLISPVGDQLGQTVTLEPPIPKWQVDLFPLGTMKSMHLISTVIERLFNQAPVSEESGPTFEEIMAQTAAKTIILKTSNVSLGAYGLILPVTNVVVAAGDVVFLDPENLDRYHFRVEPGSPKFRSVLFPLLLDMDAVFNLETFVNGKWTSVGVFDELATYDFGVAGVDQFRFFILDRNTQLTPASIAAFMSGVKFASDGVVNGMVSAISTQQETPSLCSILGNDRKPSLLDQDIFEFVGQKGETVMVGLQEDTEVAHTGISATLMLLNKKNWLMLRIDRGDLSNKITTTLKEDGVYYIVVAEQPKGLLAKNPFKGGYCLTLEASPETETTFIPTGWVE